MEKQLSRHRIRSYIAFLIVTILLGVLGRYAAIRIDQVNQTSTEIEANWLPSTKILGKIKANIIEYRLYEMEHVLSLQAAEMRVYEYRQDSVLQELNANRKRYLTLISSQEEQSLYQLFLSDWDGYLKISRESIELSRKNKNREATALLRGTSHQLYLKARQTLDTLIDLNEQSATATSRRGDQLKKNFLSMLVIILSLGFMALLIFVYDTFKHHRQDGLRK